MVVNYNATLFAIVDSVVMELCTNAKENNSHSLEKVVRFISDQHLRMPDYLRFPFKLLVLSFDAWSLPFTGRPFHRLSHSNRWRQIQAFKNSRLGFRRDLIRFFETLAIFAWYSEAYRKYDLTGF